MNFTGLVLAAAIVLNIVYFGVSIKAFQHVKQSEKEKKTYVLFSTDIWWPFYTDAFENEARIYCIYGQILFLCTVGAYIAWAFLRYS